MEFHNYIVPQLSNNYRFFHFRARGLLAGAGRIVELNNITSAGAKGAGTWVWPWPSLRVSRATASRTACPFRAARAACASCRVPPHHFYVLWHSCSPNKSTDAEPMFQPPTNQSRIDSRVRIQADEKIRRTSESRVRAVQ